MYDSTTLTEVKMNNAMQLIIFRAEKKNTATGRLLIKWN